MTIAEFAQLVADVVGYRGRFVFDSSRPDGAPQKLLNVSELTRLGWRAKTPLREGISVAYTDFLANGRQRSRIRLQEDVVAHRSDPATMDDSAPTDARSTGKTV
jgi:hypothetical protein